MKVIGRNESKTAKLGTAYSVPLGKVFDTKASKISLGEEVYLDVNEPHMVVICGKRGYGKSYTMGVIAEGLFSLPQEARGSISIVVIDAMGVFWTMQQPSGSNREDFLDWQTEPRGFPITVYYPEGLANKYRAHGQFFHKGFQLYPSELELSDWLYMLDIGEAQAQAALLSQILKKAKALRGSYYALEDVLDLISDSDAADNITTALERKVDKAISWGIFSDRGERLEDVFKPGSSLVFDLSGAGELPWNVRTFLTALLSRRMYSKRAFFRTNEEIAKIYGEEITVSFPLVWLFLDEAHLFAPTEKSTPATEPLLEWVRQGRRPGLSLVMATQQPGALDRRILSQCDTLVVQRLTAGQDSSAIGARISEIHGTKSLSEYMKLLPKEPGYAIVLNDLTEEAVPVRIRPRQSWDGGGSAKIEDYVRTGLP